jgi:hypothetical protein
VCSTHKHQRHFYSRHRTTMLCLSLAETIFFPPACMHSFSPSKQQADLLFHSCGRLVHTVHEPRNLCRMALPCSTASRAPLCFLLGNHVPGGLAAVAGVVGAAAEAGKGMQAGRAPRNPGGLPGPAAPLAPVLSRGARICRLAVVHRRTVPAQQRDPIRVESSRSCAPDPIVPRMTLVFYNIIIYLPKMFQRLVKYRYRPFEIFQTSYT